MQSCVFFSLMQVSVRYGVRDVGLLTGALVVSRGVFTVALASSLLVILRIPAPPRHRAPHVLLRGALGSCALACKYYCVSLLSVSAATAVIFTYPVFTIIVEAIFLGESFGLVEALSSILSLIGLALIATGSSNHNPLTPIATDAAATAATTPHSSAITPMESLRGIAYGVVAAILSSFALVLTRFIGTSAHFLWNVTSLGMFSLCLGLALCGRDAVPAVVALVATPPAVLAASGAGLGSFIGASSLNRAIQLLPAGTVSVIRNIDIPIAFAFGAYFLGERHPSRESVAGALVIMLATVWLGTHRLRPAAPSAPDPAPSELDPDIDPTVPPADVVLCNSAAPLADTPYLPPSPPPATPR